MSVATKTDGMKYEIAGTKRVTNGKRAAEKMAEQLGSGTLIWLLVKRHKVGLLAIGNIVLVLNWAFPLWPQLLLGLVGK